MSKPSPELGTQRCPDCDKAARHAHSDATTPGFFYPTCEKHRPVAAPEQARSESCMSGTMDYPLMICTHCTRPIVKGQKYYRTKKGPHHSVCPIPAEAQGGEQTTKINNLLLRLFENICAPGDCSCAPHKDVYDELKEIVDKETKT